MLHFEAFNSDLVKYKLRLCMANSSDVINYSPCAEILQLFKEFLEVIFFSNGQMFDSCSKHTSIKPFPKFNTMFIMRPYIVIIDIDITCNFYIQSKINTNYWNIVFDWGYFTLFGFLEIFRKYLCLRQSYFTWGYMKDQFVCMY